MYDPHTIAGAAFRPAACCASSTCPEAAAGPYRVLLVDDHPVMRECSRSMLQSHPDLQVVGEASNGLEAIILARRFRPRLIVMDVSMPVMDGIEATRRIKIEMPEIRVVGFSSFDDAGIAEAMRRAGADAYLPKSSTPSQLLSAVMGCLLF